METFLLFGCVFEASMIDRRIGDRPVSLEFTIGKHNRVSIQQHTYRLKIGSETQVNDLMINVHSQPL